MKHLDRILALLGALSMAACGSAGGLTSESASRPSTAEMEALYWARLDSARTSFTEADTHFMTGMIAHHAQALVMSRLAPSNDAGPQVRTLAARIINAQQDEIALMQQWLRERGQPVPEIHIEGIHLMVHGAGHHDHAMHMPGMLTQEELQELAAVRGPEFDRLFLIRMIQHHAGAVRMVDDLFAADGAALDEAAFKLASSIHVDQVTEIARMESMLDQMSAAGDS